MCYRCKAFSLIEILVVIFIITISIGITYPVATKLYEKFQKKIESFEKKMQKNDIKFKKFIKDE